MKSTLPAVDIRVTPKITPAVTRQMLSTFRRLTNTMVYCNGNHSSQIDLDIKDGEIAINFWRYIKKEVLMLTISSRDSLEVRRIKEKALEDYLTGKAKFPTGL